MPRSSLFGTRIVETQRMERMNAIHAMLSAHGAVPVSRFLSTLDCSLATFKRDIDFLRKIKKVPIVWDRENSGYRLVTEPEPHA